MTVGFIGFGDMGSDMAAHVAKKDGREVLVYDIDPARLESAKDIGVTPVDGIAAIGRRAEVTVIMVSTDAQVEDVVGELVKSGRKGALFVVASTIHPKTMRKLDKEVRRAGMNLIDAPVVFGRTGAKEGTLVSLCGGREEDVDKARGVLDCYSKAVYHMGPIGSGQLTKTVNNMLHWSSCVANFEAILLGKRYGLDGQRLRQVLINCPADNGSLRRWDSTRFTWHEKDMDIALDLAQEGGLMLPLFGQVDQLIKNLKPSQVKGLLYEDSTTYLGQEVTAMPAQEDS